MKGYKVFNPDWTCRGFQFEVGKTFEEDVKPECCDRGFHFCTKASDCFRYYDFNPDNKVAEVEALGDIDTHSDDTKCCTNKLHIIREITWQEVLDLVNLGTTLIVALNGGMVFLKEIETSSRIFQTLMLKNSTRLLESEFRR